MWLVENLAKTKTKLVYTDLIKDITALSITYSQNKEFWKSLIQFIENEDVKKYERKDKLINFIPSKEGDEYGLWFENAIDNETRKILAANFTENEASDYLITKLPKNRKFTNIIDPFSGSARLILSYLRQVKVSFPSITIGDISFYSILLSYCRLVDLFLQRKEDTQKIHIWYGDAYNKFSNNIYKQCFDLILINPPFTRTHRFNDVQKENISKLKNQYNNLIEGQPGLHIYALLLSLHMLEENGYIIAVLPASTLTSSSSTLIRRELISVTNIRDITIPANKKSFSDSSEVKEIIISINNSQPKPNYNIEFSKINLSSHSSIIASHKIQSDNLIRNWNWMKFFSDPIHLKLENQLLESNMIDSGSQLDLKIIRGVEMYGPNFFCLPNVHFSISTITDDDLILYHAITKKEISIPIKFVIKALRQPKLYINDIIPNVNEYLLSIPHGEIHQIEGYLKLNYDEGSIARKRFNEKWLSHIHKQLETKQPFGNMFFIDKFSLGSSSVICHYSEEQLTSTKNFYVVTNISPKEAKILTAWVNSTIYLFLYILNRREIGGSYGRMQIEDLRKTKLFLNFQNLSKSKINLILKEFDNAKNNELPSIYHQVNLELRKKIDLVLLSAIGFTSSQAKIMLKEITNLVISYLDDFKILDN